MPIDIFEARRKSLEEEFFNKQNETLKEKLKAHFAQQATRQGLKEMTGVTDEKVLDALMALNLSQETLIAFGLYPLVEVAWADGAVDERERKALLAAAKEHGIHPGSPAQEVLDEWLRHPPRAAGRLAWRAYAAELAHKLPADERRKIREEMVARARAVATASGGFLGLGRRMSEKEEGVLAALAAAFPD